VRPWVTSQIGDAYIQNNQTTQLMDEELYSVSKSIGKLMIMPIHKELEMFDMHNLKDTCQKVKSPRDIFF